MFETKEMICLLKTKTLQIKKHSFADKTNPSQTLKISL